mgnify:CR=1 FL=1
MKSFPPELIYVLIFVAIALFQFMVKKLGQQVQQEPQEPMPDEDLSGYPEEVTEIAAASSVSNAAVGHFGRTEVPKASSARPRSRFSRRSLMGTRREVRNAVVIASIIGPCRAFEPHDDR